MIFAANISPVTTNRSVLAGERSVEARVSLSHCEFCAHGCGVNRLAGERGLCHAGDSAHVFSAQMEVSDELELIPTFAIAFGGCDLRCSFCITGKESWNAHSGVPLDKFAVAKLAMESQRNGAKSIMILGGEPTIHLQAALEIVSLLPDSVKLVWKTNAHGSAQARGFLDGIFDVWLADYKFGNNECARRLARVENYSEIVRENLFWANEHSELIVRHLVMPGHVDCCWKPIAQWISENLPNVKVNLRSGFWPAWQARKHVELRGTTSQIAAQRAREIAAEYDLNLVE